MVNNLDMIYESNQQVIRCKRLYRGANYDDTHGNVYVNTFIVICDRNNLVVDSHASLYKEGYTIREYNHLTYDFTGICSREMHFRYVVNSHE